MLKAIAQKIPVDEYEAYRQPADIDTTMYTLLEQLEQLSLDSTTSDRSQTKGTDKCKHTI